MSAAVMSPFEDGKRKHVGMFEPARLPRTAVVPSPPASAVGEEDLEAMITALEMNIEGAVNNVAARYEATAREKERVAQQAKDNENMFNAIKNAATHNPLPVDSPEVSDEDLDLDVESLAAQLNQRLKGAAADKMDAAKTREQLIKELEAARANIARMERAEKNLSSEVQVNNAEKEKLKAELATMRMEEERLVAKVTNATRENERLSAEITTLKKAKETFGGEITTLKTDKEKLRVELTTVKKEKDRGAAEITTLKTDKEKLRVELTTMKMEKDRVAADLTTVKKEKDRGTAEITTLKTDKEKLRVELTTMKMEKDRVAADLTTAKKEKERGTAEITNLKTAKDNINDQLKATTSEKEKVEEQLRKLQTDYLNQDNAFADLRRRFEDHERASRQKLANLVHLLRKSNALLDEMGCR